MRVPEDGLLPEPAPSSLPVTSNLLVEDDKNQKKAPPPQEERRMKLYSILLVKYDTPGDPVILDSVYDVSSFGFLKRGTSAVSFPPSLPPSLPLGEWRWCETGR